MAKRANAVPPRINAIPVAILGSHHQSRQSDPHEERGDETRTVVHNTGAVRQGWLTPCCCCQHMYRRSGPHLGRRTLVK